MHPSRRNPSILRPRPPSTKKLRLSKLPLPIASPSNGDAEATTPYNGLSRQIIQSRPSFDLLPDVALIILLKKLPLIDLISLRSVCRRWNYLATNIIIKQTRSLQLSSYYSNEYEQATRDDNVRVRIDLMRFLDIEPNSFDFILGISENIYNKWRRERSMDKIKPPKLWGRFLYLKPKCAAGKIMDTFPCITTLIIFDCLLEDMEIVRLLNRWNHTLTTLKLVTFEKQFNWSLIFAAINRLPNLQHLSLFAHSGFYWQPRLPFLPRLSSFQLTFWDHIGPSRRNWLSHFVGQLNPTTLRQLDIGIFSPHNFNAAFLRYNLRQLLTKHRIIAANLKRLQFPAITQSFFHFLVHHFPSVTWLDIELRSTNVFNKIVCLKEMKFLALRSNQYPYTSCPLNLSTSQQLEKISPLVSVKTLFLLDFTLKETLLKKLFPNVVTIVQRRRGDDNDVDIDYLSIGQVA